MADESMTGEPPLRRVVVVGTTGSGKTTMAGALAARLGLPHVELDALHWGAHWTPVPADVFRARVAAALAGAGWVVDGNYHAVRDLVRARADTVVWLDFALPVILARLLRRTVGRSVRRTELWSGNRENLLRSFFTGDSILVWALRTYRQRRREYPLLFAQPAHRHIRVVHLRSPRAAHAWLASIAEAAPAGSARPGG